MTDTNGTAQEENTDRELFRDGDDNSVHVDDDGAIAINVGGYVIVKSLQEWHDAARRQVPAGDDGDRLRILASMLSEEHRDLLVRVADELQAHAGQ